MTCLIYWNLRFFPLDYLSSLPQITSLLLPIYLPLPLMHPLIHLQHYFLLCHCLISHISITQVDHINRCTSPFPPNLPPPHVRNRHAILFPFMMFSSSTALPCTSIAFCAFRSLFFSFVPLTFLSFPIHGLLSSPLHVYLFLSMLSLLIHLSLSSPSVFLHSPRTESIDLTK